MSELTEREGFSSRLGFILVSAGCAIGIGNVWRFPFTVGEGGGAIFVSCHLGHSGAYHGTGRGTRQQKNHHEWHEAAGKKGHFWHIHGWVGIRLNMKLKKYEIKKLNILTTGGEFR